MATPEIEYLTRAKTHAIATWRNIVLIECRLEVPDTSAVTLRQAGASLRRAYPEGFGYVTIVESGCAAPSREARAGASQFLDEYADAIRGSVVIYLGDGLRGAFVRAVVTSMLLLTRSRGVVQEVYGSLDEGSRWLAGRVRGLDARALVEVAEQLRAATLAAK